MTASEKIACFPPIGDYSEIVGLLIERCLGYKSKACPPTTKKTVETGSKNSPDMVCTPFKITLGNFIEAIENGANVIVMPATGCRLGFYDILQKQILTDMGYEFEMIPLFDYTPTAIRLYNSLVKVKPDLVYEDFAAVLGTVVKIVVDMDILADFMRRNMAFEVNKGEFEKNYRLYLGEAKRALNPAEAEKTGAKYKEIFRSIKINKPASPIRIGIIGDLYTVIEPHGNCYIEKWLAENGVEIIRPLDLTLAATTLNVAGPIEKSGGYTSYSLGGSANNSIASAYEMVNNGIDGIVHMKAATCSPEITAMTILQNMSRDYNVPIIYFTFDTETGEAGFHTRLEAFMDMLKMKRGNI